MKETQARYVAKRAELLAEEFLLELGATYVGSLQDSDIGLDYVAFFPKGNETTKIIAVEVKSTEQSIKNRFPLKSKLLKRLINLNIPALLVVIDVKSNEIYFTWAKDTVPSDQQQILDEKESHSIQLRRSTPEEIQSLKTQIAAY